MAKFSAELPNDLIKAFEDLETNCEDMMAEMTQAGARRVYDIATSNMRKVFKSVSSIEPGLKVTKYWKNANGVYVTKVGFFGYVPGSPRTKRHPYGTPIPLIAMAREYGTSRGEARRPFFRKAFKKNEIEKAMLKVQEKYLPKE